MRIALALTVTTVLLGGCTTTAHWPDRPEVDFGCDGPGHCRVRGLLEIPPEGGDARLTLDDGRRLSVVLPKSAAARPDRWTGRRVAVGGEAVAVTDGLRLYARRLSLKADR